MISLNTYIKDLAYTYYIGYSSAERSNIKRTAESVQTNLKGYFLNDINSVEIFGSYKRDTILPRRYDSKSDIDLLVLFNHDTLNLTAETYRNRLKYFAQLYYPRSGVSKTFPTITIELNHIKLDLVPAAMIGSWWEVATLRIPGSDGNWIKTYPHDFSNRLTERNQKYGEIVKPIIRLMKAWNASHGSPYDSFNLEQEIADMNFSGDNYETGFFYAIEKLSTFGMSFTAT